MKQGKAEGLKDFANDCFWYMRAREALLFVIVHLLTGAMNEEREFIIFLLQKLKETLCASWAIDYFCSGKPCSAAYGGGL